MIEIPTLPVALLTLLGFLAPYAVAFLNGVLPFVREPWQRKLVAVVVSIVLAAAGLVGYFLATGSPLPSDGVTWVGFVLLVLVVQQTSYGLVTKQGGADAIERAAGGDDDDTKASLHLTAYKARHRV